MRTASVRSYFDADILGLGKLLATLRPDATYPGGPGSVLQEQAPALPHHDPRTPQLEVVMCQWRAIEALVNQEGPLLSVATRTSLRPVPLA